MLRTIKILTNLLVISLSSRAVAAVDFTCRGNTEDNDGITLSLNSSAKTIYIRAEQGQADGPRKRLPRPKTLEIKFSDQLGSTTTIYASRDNSGVSDDDIVLLTLKFNRETGLPYYAAATFSLATNRYQELRQSVTFTSCE